MESNRNVPIRGRGLREGSVVEKKKPRGKRGGEGEERLWEEKHPNGGGNRKKTEPEIPLKRGGRNGGGRKGGLGRSRGEKNTWRKKKKEPRVFILQKEEGGKGAENGEAGMGKLQREGKDPREHRKKDFGGGGRG